MRTLGIDIETYSSVDLTKSGVYAYTEAPDFGVLIFGYCYDDDPVRVVDLASGEQLPEDVLAALTDPAVRKAAYNANFERTCLAAYLGRPMPPEQWYCSAVHARMLGLPGSLEAVGKVLRLPEDSQKMRQGKALIRYFSIPCRATKINGGRTRNLPRHDPDKWALYKAYNAQDVEVERTVRRTLARYPIPAQERKLWELDQEINDRGVGVDRTLVTHAIACDAQYQERMEARARALTGLDNPGSVSQLKDWIEQREGISIDSLSKDTLPALIGQATDPQVREMLRVRRAMAKTSVKKYDAIDRAVCKDDRIHGTLMFYGASRTGRWAGRILQPQNLPQNHMTDLDDARGMLRAGDYEGLEMLYDSVPDVLSQLIRTALIPAPGNRFMVADFSAIEARVIAWMAGEQWRMDVFATHGKIYEASAEQMFRLPAGSVRKGDPMRQKGKIAELALGYGGSVGALKAMGALKMGLEEDELQPLVDRWRRTNPAIIKLWWDVDAAARHAIADMQATTLQYGLRIHMAGGMLFVRLPSGRSLVYQAPRLEVGRNGRESIIYDGVDQTRKTWGPIETYGPKLVENIIQAIARDCLAVAMLRLAAAGYDIVFSVHDEVIMDVPEGQGSLDEVLEIMGTPIQWAPGLPLRADGYECEYYRKD